MKEHICFYAYIEMENIESRYSQKTWWEKTAIFPNAEDDETKSCHMLSVIKESKSPSWTQKRSHLTDTHWMNEYVSISNSPIYGFFFTQRHIYCLSKTYISVGTGDKSTSLSLPSFFFHFLPTFFPFFLHYFSINIEYHLWSRYYMQYMNKTDKTIFALKLITLQ